MIYSSLADFPDALHVGFFSAICFIQQPRRFIQKTTTALGKNEKATGDISDLKMHDVLAMFMSREFLRQIKKTIICSSVQDEFI